MIFASLIIIMEVKASLNNLRTAPRKVRQVVDLIRNKNVFEARNFLEFTIKKSSDPILKLLNSAVASALNDFKLSEANLYVSKITVDEGPKLKRWHPMSRGRAYPIIKRTSHVTLVLAEKNSTAKQPKNEKIEKGPKGYPAKEVKKTAKKEVKTIKKTIKTKKHVS